MRSKFTILAFVLAFAGVTQASTPVEKMVPVDHVYAPFGFDSNDSVEVVVTGFLPNLCHKAPSTSIKIEGNKVDITVTSLYYHDSNPFCTEMIVPFTKSVTLGVLDKGNYELTVNGKSQWEKKEEIQIAESTSNSIDEFSYAYVTYIDKENGDGDTVILKGYNPSDCFELDRIDYVNNKKDAYSVLPKMKQVREFCPMKLVAFEYEWKVPKDLANDKVLIHVRTMEGNSVNTIFHR